MEKFYAKYSDGHNKKKRFHVPARRLLKSFRPSVYMQVCQGGKGDLRNIYSGRFAKMQRVPNLGPNLTIKLGLAFLLSCWSMMS